MERPVLSSSFTAQGGFGGAVGIDDPAVGSDDDDAVSDRFTGGGQAVTVVDGMPKRTLRAQRLHQMGHEAAEQRPSLR
jgi:hypothetical protein